MPNILDDLHYISEEVIIDTYIKNFIFYFGESEAIELNNKIGHSDKTDKYLNNIVRNNFLPQVDDVLSLVSGIGFMAFSKSEKLCMAGFSVLQFWQMFCQMNNRYCDIEHMKKTMFLMGYKCSKMKMNKVDNFFEKYFKEMVDLINLRKAQGESNYNYSKSKSKNIQDSVYELVDNIEVVIINALNMNVFVNNKRYELINVTTVDSKHDHLIKGAPIIFAAWDVYLKTEDHCMYISGSPVRGVTEDGDDVEVYLIYFIN